MKFKCLRLNSLSSLHQTSLRVQDHHPGHISTLDNSISNKEAYIVHQSRIDPNQYLWNQGMPVMT